MFTITLLIYYRANNFFKEHTATLEANEIFN